jgi:CPA1 family monovalent cation:H+ antiporter
VVFVLNVLAFMLIGLQLKGIGSGLNTAEWLDYIVVGISVCGAAIFSRIVWVTGVAAVSAWWCSACRFGDSRPTDAVALNPRAAALVGWCGMRGIVTLAAALALPTGEGGAAPFPYRDLIIFAAFATVLGTLIVQGLTLRPLMMRLKLQDDGSVEREVLFARAAALQAALSATDGAPANEAVEILRSRYSLRLRRANAELEELNKSGWISRRPNNGSSSLQSAADANLIRTAIRAEREHLSALRSVGAIGDAAFQRIEQELDWRELDLQQFFEEE